MTGLQDERPSGEDSVYEILNRFIGIPEQTYDQFEASFTHRPAEKTSHDIPSQGQYHGSLKTDAKEELNNMADSADVDTVTEDKSEARPAMDSGIKVSSTFNLDLSHRCKIQTDEVQPFALEEGFDYDRVSLSPKFSEAELKLLKTLRNQRIKNEDP